MKKQKIYCFLAGAVLMASLAACGGGEKESSASGTSGRTEAESGKAFFWNQQTWEKAGLSVPKSFSELLAAGPIFKEKLGDDYYPMAAGEYDLMMLLT